MSNKLLTAIVITIIIAITAIIIALIVCGYGEIIVAILIFIGIFIFLNFI